MHGGPREPPTASVHHDPGARVAAELQSAVRLRRRLCTWFDSPLGRSLQAIETNRLRSILPRLYGTVVVQLGAIGKMDMMESSPAPTHVVLDLLQFPNHAAAVQALAEALPFAERSVEVVLLPHTLDFTEDPHQVLREVDRVLTPEGHMIVLGFNPMSLWGITRLFARRRQVPWCGGFFRLARIKDWLGLLEYELVEGQMLYYRPPLQSESVRDRLYFLDHMGDRWWPMMAAAYIVVAKKRVLGVTPLRLRWHSPAIAPGLSNPVARNMRCG